MSDVKTISLGEGDEKEELPLRYLTSKRRKGKDLAALADEIGVQPFEILLKAAKGDWQGLGYSKPTQTRSGPNGDYEVELLPIELRIIAAKEAAQYLHPKKKAIEHSGSEDAAPIRIEGSSIDLVRKIRANS